MTMTRGQEPGSRTLWHFGLEARRTSRGWSLFRGKERVSPLGRSRPETWRRARLMHPELPEKLDYEAFEDPEARRGAKRLLEHADGEEGVRADVAILLAKKLAPATRLAVKMRRRPGAAEWRLARRMQRLVEYGDVPDAAFECAIQKARAQRADTSTRDAGGRGAAARVSMRRAPHGTRRGSRRSESRGHGAAR